MSRRFRVFVAFAALILATGWTHPGGDAGHSKFAPETQITPANVSSLRPAWRFSTGDMAARPEIVARWKFQATPILFQNQLIFCTPRNEVIALHPGTGAGAWRFDPQVDDAAFAPQDRVCRGVTPWSDPTLAEDAPCKHRVLTATLDRRLIALDARSGATCAGFGTEGEVRIEPEKPLKEKSELKFTSPPAIARDTVLIGSQITDGGRVDTPSGMVRAFNVRTGALKWTFDPIPRDPADPRRASWEGDSADKTGAANAWTPIAADEARGLFFIATGSASPDYFGGTRKGANADANSIVALEAETGRRVWAFQTVRHDIWDYDVSAPPTLVTLMRNGQPVDALIQVTKMGFVFTLDRATGAPLFPIEERAVPKGDIPEEHYAATQPVPVLPKPLVPEDVTAFGVTPWDRAVCEQRLASLRYQGVFTPPSLQGTLIHPFSGGGANWGGLAFDPQRQIMVLNTSGAAEFARLIPRANDPETAYAGERFPQDGAPYTLDRGLLRSPIGAPCTDPPWGRLHAIDMRTGEELWRAPLGTFEDLAPLGDLILPKGTPNLGGPLLTQSGLIFIGAAMDDYLRAFDVQSGRELWKGRLPGGGQASPMSYSWEGRQFVVIAAGGHGLMGATPGDQVVAFALPTSNARPALFGWWEQPTPRLLTLLGFGFVALIGMIFALRRKRTANHPA
jgi:quinoprotein glucose dehydrogenase